VAGVVGASLAPGLGEGLAGAATSPNREVCRNTGKVKSLLPSADSGEEVSPVVVFKVVGSDIFDAPVVNATRADVPCSREVAEPRHGERLQLVVESHHLTLAMSSA
tara:strand:- start:1001 stop:1318 length:318 start_codon:yes stop_codon:yes gene_type:complete